MNGIHDMGGLHGFGRVPYAANELVFHSRWESRVFCMTQVLDTKGIWNLDEHRHEIEKMNPADYIQDGYYGRWLFAMEHILHRRHIVHHHEIDQRVHEMNQDISPTHLSSNTARNWPLPKQDKIPWGAWHHDKTVSPRYHVGNYVRVRNIHPSGHTRVTAYTRGKVGMIHRVNDQAWVLPDAHAHHQPCELQAVYTIRFTAHELWGAQAEDNHFLYIDLSENHIEASEDL